MSDEKNLDNSSNAGQGDVPVEQEESFAALFEKSINMPERLTPGQKVKSRVVDISGDLVYVDLGGKSEGIIDLGEFIEEDGTCRIKEGDELEAFFTGVQDGARKLTTLVHGCPSGKLNSIRDAHSAGLPVTGVVKSEVKGGFEVSVDGIRCFCPFSQIDLRSNGTAADGHVNKTFEFKVLEFKNNGRNIVLSRRALLEQERQSRVEKLKESLQVGMDIAATVRSIQKFGAFVDLGGIDGLIPLSEISWGKAESLDGIVAVGQKVTAKILSLDWDNNRLALSIKATIPDPWIGATEKFPDGSKVSGTVVRLVPFGAFVNIEPGIDGLIHISNFGTGKRINHPKEVVGVGQQVEAYVLSTDPRNRKLSLSMQPKPEPRQAVFPAAGEFVDGVVEKVMPFGIFLKLSSGLTGLIPNSEMGTPAGSDHSRMFPAGTEMQVVVLEVDAGRNRISLSRRGVTDKDERDEFKRYKDSTVKEEKSSDGLGRLGEILKARMEEKKFSIN
ncbi:MAG: S1 RNA-binding domain-containing protein [Nitrospirae bacterium]|nr:S1 RNA-binding domain-containing protein [Nitrospirota bacterium]MCL5236834.1 S1 RNA-binding domain-containing protein [Nitrospirota bacterium]